MRRESEFVDPRPSEEGPAGVRALRRVDLAATRAVRFTELLVDAHTPCLAITLDDLRIVDANAAACERLNCSRDEILDADMQSVVSVSTVDLARWHDSLRRDGQATLLLEGPADQRFATHGRLHALAVDTRTAVVIVDGDVAVQTTRDPRSLRDAAEPSSRRPVVLLVDDEPALRALGRRILERQGMAVIEASNGDDALRIARSRRRIDVLVTDVSMPGMSGSELADRLVREQSGVGVVFISGIAVEQLHRMALGRSRTAVLEKPFAPSSLVDLVRQFLPRTEDVA